jgi:hypothetical protein
MATIEDDHILFETGQSLYVEGGIVGIGHGLVLFGADGPLSCDNLSPQECAELAEVIFDRWQAFKAMKARES